MSARLGTTKDARKRGEEREALAFLRDMDPVFTLRFQDGSTVQVTLTPTDDRRFALTEYTGQANRQVDYHIDL